MSNNFSYKIALASIALTLLNTDQVSADDAACAVTSIQQLPSTFSSYSKSPKSGALVAAAFDAKGIEQIYTSNGRGQLGCITCVSRPGAPAIDRNKYMPNWHPSGAWLAIGVEETTYGLNWLPQDWKRGFLTSGVWLNIWMTTPSGNHWYQLTNYQDASGQPDGYTGVAFTPNGSLGVWAELIGGTVGSTATFGRWRLYKADFVVANNMPSLANKTDITPPGAIWIEPGNVSPDGHRILISTDLGLTDAQGQDQWSLDLNTGQLQQLTNTPAVWDEHGLYSPTGGKIVFISSYPYRDDPKASQIFGLKTEFMLMNADGSDLQQLTHFNVPGYPESQPSKTVAGIAVFVGRSQLYAETGGPNFIPISWNINFAGNCG